MHYIRSVIYFADVKEENWQSVKFVKDKISSKEIIQRLTREVVEYEKKILLA